MSMSSPTRPIHSLSPEEIHNLTVFAAYVDMMAATHGDMSQSISELSNAFRAYLADPNAIYRLSVGEGPIADEAITDTVSDSGEAI